MLDVGFHATNGKKLSLIATNRESRTVNNKLYSYVEVSLNTDLTLFLSPENATILAKALLSQVQQIEEKELTQNNG